MGSGLDQRGKGSPSTKAHIIEFVRMAVDGALKVNLLSIIKRILKEARIPRKRERSPCPVFSALASSTPPML